MPGSQVGPVPIICMYGVTMDGNSVAAYVHGFSPYFYIPAGHGFKSEDCAAFRVSNFFVENGRLSDRYRIGTDTGRIVSNRIGKFCIGRYYMQRCKFSSC